MAGIRILDIGHQHLAEEFPGEDIDTHGCKVALRMLRFLFEFYDTSGFISVHDTETACFFHRNSDNCDGCICLCFFVGCKHLVIVHFINMVTGKNENVFRIKFINEINILGDCICSSAIYIQILICFLTWRKNVNTAVFSIKTPASAGCHITVQLDRFILCKYTYNINATVGTVA